MSGRRHKRGWKTVAASLALAAAGCSALKGPSVPLDSSAGMFERASISYRVDSARINTSLRTGGSEAQLVSYNAAQPATLPADSVASVQIKYPHPQKKAGYAEVVVRFADANASQWTWRHCLAIAGGYEYEAPAQEVWTLDIPQQELARIVNRLQTAGYFQDYEKGDSATFNTELDGVTLAKTWRQLPDLDALIIRVRTEGRLISSLKAPGAADPTQPPSTSVAAYRDMLADDAAVVVVSDDPAIATDLPAASVANNAGVISIVRLPAVDARY